MLTNLIVMLTGTLLRRIGSSGSVPPSSISGSSCTVVHTPGRRTGSAGSFAGTAVDVAPIPGVLAAAAVAPDGVELAVVHHGPVELIAGISLAVHPDSAGL